MSGSLKGCGFHKRVSENELVYVHFFSGEMACARLHFD